jgi:iron complex transport system permease protein
MLGADAQQFTRIHLIWVRRAVLILAIFFCSTAVSFAGNIGYVGLIIPHVTRRWLGLDNRLNLVVCFLLGAAYLLLADGLALVCYKPAGLPVGIVTALTGVPFFVYLLRKRLNTF